MRIELQLFASVGGGSASGHTASDTKKYSGGKISSSESSSEGGSSSSTVGHSETNTTGHSETNSNSHTESTAQSVGGSHGEQTGKTWLSGEVDANTQANKDKYSQDYTEGQKVQDTYQRLQESLDNKPTFQSTYENKLNELYDSIMNREKFNYNFNADSMYQLYKDQYTTAGKTAMEDSMAQAALLNGGYGSSYAQSVGQQTYQNYMQQLNNMLPELRNAAYQMYQDEGNQMLQQYQMTNDAYDREYGQYRDQVSDWNNDRNFNLSNYQNERDFDYNQFVNNRDYWMQEYWKEREAEKSTSQTNDDSNWNAQQSESNTESHSETDYWEKQIKDYWENTNTTNWNNSSSSSMSGLGSSSSSSSSSKVGTKGSTTTEDAAGMFGEETKNKVKEMMDSNKTPYYQLDVSRSSNLNEANDDDVKQLLSELTSAANERQYQQIVQSMKDDLGFDSQDIKALEDVIKNWKAKGII